MKLLYSLVIFGVMVVVGRTEYTDLGVSYATIGQSDQGQYDVKIVSDASYSRHRRQAEGQTPADATTIPSVSMPTTTTSTAATTTTTAATTPSTTVMTQQPNQDGDGNTTEPESMTTNTPTVKPTPYTFPPNTTIKNDTHTYYTQKAVASFTHFIERNSIPKTQRHFYLSNKHRTAAKIPLTFKLNFYGHDIRSVTIATGGFIYMSDFLHPWLTATQYIAPLMANFDFSLSNDSDIWYADTGDMLVVWWENVVLRDDRHVGSFTFQAQVNANGTIIFAYKSIPKAVDYLNAEDHAVKVGLSDAYYVDERITDYLTRRTIYEYHRVEVDLTTVASSHAVILRPVQTCNQLTTCYTCVNTKLPNFDCRYCHAIGHCSDGMDRRRQSWLDNQCDSKNASVEDHCNTSGNSTPHGNGEASTRVGTKDVGWKVAVAFVVIIAVAIIAGVVAWVVYAYRNPNSAAGRWLIEHRPQEIGRTIAQKARFWKKDDRGEAYGVSVGGGGESLA